MKIQFITMLILALCLSGCGRPLMNTADIAPGITKAEMTERYGVPNITLDNGESVYVWRIHDHAYGREYNHYSAVFKDDKLTSFLLLPKDQQEEAPRMRSFRFGGGNAVTGAVITPNAYGPGVHIDQYGRPVKVVPGH